MSKHEIVWVDPVETEVVVDWNCPCLADTDCKDEIEKWYKCEYENRKKPRTDRTPCNEFLQPVIACQKEIAREKEGGEEASVTE